jgi:FkbM family methyltransferase
VHLAFNGETLDNVQVLLHAAGWTDDRPLIQVHPTSRWFFKCWNDADMARVIDHLQTVHGYQAVITSGPDDKERDRVAGIIAQCNSMPLNLSGQLTLKQMAALTSLCDFYFGVDTAPMHMAAALNIPVIALFGPSGAFDWGPWPNGWTGNGTPYPQPNGIQYSHPHIVIQTDWECVPCGQDGCRGSKRSACLEKLSCTEVVRIVDEHIKQLKGETITVAHHTKPAAAPLVERRQKERFDSRSRCILNKGIRYYLGHFPITDGKKQILDLVRPLIMPANDKVSVQTKYGFELIVTLRNPEQERLYFYQDHDERYEVNNIRNIIKPGDVCWDIGANIGFYTCLFSILTGAPGKVVAFEPVRATLRFLSANVAINRLHNVVVISKALGDRRETREIFYRTPDTAEGTASFRTSIGSYSEQVEIDTVDHLYNGLNLPDFIKIDVEGYQTEVLNGARRFLKHHQPLVMLEVRERDQDATEGLEAYLRELGYMLFGFRKHSLYECKTLKDVRRRNVLLVKPGTPYFERIAGLLSGN